MRACWPFSNRGVFIMYGNFLAYFDDYVNSILKKYKQYQPVYLTSPIGFDGATASQRVTCFSAQIDNDALLFGAHLNFSQLVNVKITDTATGYSWNVLQNVTGNTAPGTPAQAIGGVQSEVTPVLPLICPFFLSRNSKLQMDFVNSAASLAASTASITWVGVRLLN